LLAVHDLEAAVRPRLDDERLQAVELVRLRFRATYELADIFEQLLTCNGDQR
jgi:hypothetical protein